MPAHTCTSVWEGIEGYALYSFYIPLVYSTCTPQMSFLINCNKNWSGFSWDFSIAVGLVLNLVMCPCAEAHLLNFLVYFGFFQYLEFHLNAFERICTTYAFSGSTGNSHSLKQACGVLDLTSTSLSRKLVRSVLLRKVILCQNNKTWMH